MKKADKEKINAIGQKLGFETLEINQKNDRYMRKSLYSIPHRLIAGIIYILVQILVFFLTWMSGDFAREVIGGYPYFSHPSFTERILPKLLFASVLHTGNGLFLVPNDLQLIPKRSYRTLIYIGNLALSLTFFLFAANAAPVNISNILYGVHDNPQQVYSNNPKDHPKKLSLINRLLEELN